MLSADLFREPTLIPAVTWSNRPSSEMKKFVYFANAFEKLFGNQERVAWSTAGAKELWDLHIFKTQGKLPDGKQ